MTTPRAERLDRLTHTFSRDQEFCEAIAATHPWGVGRLFVYRRWAHLYIPHIQEDLNAMVGKHFSAACAQDAGFWTLALTNGIYKDLGLIPYLVVRGLIWDAGFAARRSFEHTGLLAHLWHDPTKAEHLVDPESGDFKNAFVAEPDKTKAATLKAQGVQKRFSACDTGSPMSDLYRILSAYSIHGGSPHQMVTSQLEPTRFSCTFIDRPDPLEKSISRDIEVVANGCEMLCVELASVLGTFGNKYGLLPSKGGEGGLYLTKLLDRGPDSEMKHVIEAMLDDLGWTTPLIS